MPSRLIVCAVFLFTTSLLSGCGGNEFDVAPVRGKVTCAGEPLTTGAISFSPIAEGDEDPGKSALGAIGPDGTFVLTTYEPDDGAVIGKHRVSYMPPIAGEGEEGDEEDGMTLPALPLPVNHPCRFGGTAAAEIEVVAGENDLVIELTGVGANGMALSDSGEGE